MAIFPMRRKLLFTPGPLTTSVRTKLRAARDVGSRTPEFAKVTRRIRLRLRELAQDSEGELEAVLLPGSGTLGIESVVGSVSHANSHWLVVVNGAYAERIYQITKRLGLVVTRVSYSEFRRLPVDEVVREINCHHEATHIALVHCETGTGIVNPVDEIIARSNRPGLISVVDAMSSFGGISLDLSKSQIDCLVSSPNKCLEGIPGFSFVLIRRALLEGTRGNGRSFALDLFEQWLSLESTGHSRFTPPVQSVLALSAALDELEREGGVESRANRYRVNCDVLMRGMHELGFKPVLPGSEQGYIINAFHCPSNPKFDVDAFLEALASRGTVIYEGKLPGVPCFRIGTIGNIGPRDVRRLLKSIRHVLSATRISTRDLYIPAGPVTGLEGEIANGVHDSAGEPRDIGGADVQHRNWPAAGT
jgi:2-aminoethylphosphonate-pyruvate transaminase